MCPLLQRPVPHGEVPDDKDAFVQDRLEARRARKRVPFS